MKLKLCLFLFVFFIGTPNLFAGLYFNSSTGWSWNKLVLKPSAKEQLEYCQSLEEKKNYNSAIAHLELLIKVYNKSPEAVEAYMLIGELYIAQGRYNKANKYYEDLLSLQIEETSKVIQAMNKKKKKSKSTKLDDKTKQMMFQILVRDLQKTGQKGESENPLLNLDVTRIFNNLYKIGEAYLGGARYRLFGTLPLWKQKKKFISVYAYIILRSPNYVKCPGMQKEIALFKYKHKDYFEAIGEFKKLSNDYTLSPEAEDASYYVGMCHLKSSKGPAYNQETMEIAEVYINDYLINQPEGEQSKKANEALKVIKDQKAENSLIKIRFFVRRHQWEAAKIYINDVIQKYPDTNYSLEAKEIALDNKKIGEIK